MSGRGTHSAGGPHQCWFPGSALSMIARRCEQRGEAGSFRGASEVDDRLGQPARSSGHETLTAGCAPGYHRAESNLIELARSARSLSALCAARSCNTTTSPRTATRA